MIIHTVLYICVYLSIEGKSYSAASENVQDAMSVAEQACDKETQAKECIFSECKAAGNK